MADWVWSGGVVWGERIYLSRGEAGGGRVAFRILVFSALARGIVYTPHHNGAGACIKSRPTAVRTDISTPLSSDAARRLRYKKGVSTVAHEESILAKGTNNTVS